MSSIQAEPVSPRKADRDNGNNSDTPSSESVTDDEDSDKLKKKHDDELMVRDDSMSKVNKLTW